MAIKGRQERQAPTTEPGLEWADRVYNADARKLDMIPDASVHLAVTSPPYCVGKEYEHGMTWPEWVDLIHASTQEVARKLIPGGRLCINVANTGRKPYRSLVHVVEDAVEAAGLVLKGHVIWNKGPSVGTSTAWGSWCMPTSPELRDVHEYIVVAQRPGRYPRRPGERGDCTPEEFCTYTRSVWDVPTVSAQRIGHEAPFPLELPHRLIKLYTWRGDVVLDHFMGAGTTLLAARALGRHWVGVDLDPAACALAQDYLDGRRERNDRPMVIKGERK